MGRYYASRKVSVESYGCQGGEVSALLHSSSSLQHYDLIEKGKGDIYNSSTGATGQRVGRNVR